jgi:hypothetical protein
MTHTPRQRIARSSQLAVLPLGVALAAVLFALRGEPAGAPLAVALCLLALPWVVAALVVIAVLSSPLYMALHPWTQAPALDVWLGGVVLLAIAVGAQINAGLLLTWLRRPRPQPQAGLRDFLQSAEPDSKTQESDGTQRWAR